MIGKKSYRRAVPKNLAILILLFPWASYALIPRNISLDFGFGMPHLVFGQGVVKLSDHWQLGLGYGLIPGLAAVGKNTQVGEQIIDFGGGTEVIITPNIDISFNTLLPFIRYFPRENNFYIQATYALLQLKGDVTGTFQTNDALAIPAGILSGTISVDQPIPTVSVGHVWAGKVYFCDISLGLSFFLGASVTSKLATAVPDALGGEAAAEAAITQLTSQLESQLNANTLTYRNQYPFLPSLSFTFGIML